MQGNLIKTARGYFEFTLRHAPAPKNNPRLPHHAVVP
jgi:hypothetical protein